MLIKDVLDRKGQGIVSVGPGTGVREAVQKMVNEKLGAIVIAEGDKLLGIFTERDNLRLTPDRAIDLDKAVVDDHMTRDLVIGLLTDTVEQAMGTMTEKRVRHLPIMHEGKLYGMVSIGDVVKAVADKHEVEIRYLKNYIQGDIS